MIMSTAATGFGLIGLGLSTPALAQEAQAMEDSMVEESMVLEACSDIQPPCMTAEGTVMLKDGRIVSTVEAYEALGIAAPREEVETAPATVGEEAAADLEHQEVVEEDALADQLAEDMPLAETEAVETEAATPETGVDVAEQPMDTGETGEISNEDMPPVAETPVTGDMTDAEGAPQITDGPSEDAEGIFIPTDAGEAKAVEMTDEVLKAQAEEEAAQAAEEEALAPPAAAASAETGQEIEVETETVTRETTRASNEEFVNQTTVQSEKDDEGLSNLEKFLIGAVGAAVIGNVLADDDQVVANTGDRVIVERDGQLRVLKNDDALLRQPGSQVTTERFTDGSTRTTLNREDGSEVVTIRSADGRVLRRERVLVDGTRVVLFDDTQTIEAVDVTALPDTPQKSVIYTEDEDALRAALAASQAQSEALNRRFSLNQIRSIRAVRELAPEIELTNVTFASGSAAISPSEAEELAALGRAMREAIAANPREVFLVEGHTDAVGAATMNLALSDRRAESLALALTEYFDVPPENMVVQGYGERYLKVQTIEADRSNRRAAVRVITPLLAEVAAQ
jgi:outer membrane protein OmpA-like peptidoglycan-associated protein